MRNLKRALSLTLASVMLLGMMVLGTSAAGYPDVTEEHNVEAIEVLQSVGVMSGSDSGNFNPDSQVSRTEMAVIMSNLLNLKVDYFENQCRFTDVPAWAGKYVAACEASGIVSGIGNNLYGANSNVTATQAALMMLKALGYFQYASDFAGGWEQETAKLAANLSLFKGLDGVYNTTELTRNQVAQLALNTLRTPVVVADDKTLDVTTSVGDATTTVSTGKVNYVVTASNDSYARAIDNAESNGNALNGVNGYVIELGEKLYDGKLKLDKYTEDDFMRPARHWEYNSKSVGTYAKAEDLVQEYSVKVTGKTLYNLLSKDTIKDYDLIVAIDGEDNHANNALVFGKDAIVRTNDDGVGGTGKGVLTQVYVITDKEHEAIYINIINTYLAKATKDYDSKNGEVKLDAFSLDNNTKVKGEWIKNTSKDHEKINITVKDEDADIADVKEDDLYLITVADGKVQTMVKPEILAESTITKFELGDRVVTDATYDYANTAKYDVEVLDNYSVNNLKDITYNIILDKYGYLIGLEQNEDPDQYVFLTGIDGNDSNLRSKNADANVIFLDGTMKTIVVDTKKSEWSNGDELLDHVGADAPILNTWCTYSENNGVYTLKRVSDTAFPTRGNKVAQSVMNVTGTSEVKIDNKNVSLDGLNNLDKVYGNTETVYLNLELKAVKTSTNNDWYKIVDDVDSITTGIRNTGLVVNNIAGVTNLAAGGAAGSDSTDANVFAPANEIYPLFKDNGYIIAAAVIGKDDGATKSYAYIHSDDIKSERYDKATDKWYWEREVIMNGVITIINEEGDGTGLSELKKLDQGAWYEIKFDGNNNVKDVIKQTFAAADGFPNGGVGPIKDRISEVIDVQGAINEEDTVILQQYGLKAATHELHFNATGYAGTVYTRKGSNTEGFSVSPDVKVVRCEADKNGNPFDDTIDGYEGWSGLKSAINDLDVNFTGELNAVFNSSGDAIVIILVETTKGGGDIEAPDGENGYDLNVLAVLDDANDEVTFVTTGADSLNRVQKIAAVKAAAIKAGLGTADTINVEYNGGMYEVFLNNGKVAEYTEASGGVVRQAANPTPKTAYDLAFEETHESKIEDMEINEVSQLVLAGSDFVSYSADFTPTAANAMTISGIKWISDLNSKVPYFYYDRDVEGSVNNFSIHDAYLVDHGPAETDGVLTSDLHDKNIKAFAIIPFLKANGGIRFNIIFKDASNNIYWQTGEKLTGGTKDFGTVSTNYGVKSITFEA